MQQDQGDELLENDQPEPALDALSQPQLPPIGIIDLMVLTAAMSLAFALRNQLQSLGWSYNTDIIWFTTLEHIFACLYYGLPIAAAYRFYIQKKVTGRFLLEPGHWILWSILIAVAGYACTLPLLYYLKDSPDGDTPWKAIRFLPHAIVSLISSGILFWGAMKFRIWPRVLLILVAIGTAAQAAYMFGFFLIVGSESYVYGTIMEITDWIVLVLHTLTAIGLLIVAIKEIIKGPRRDLWHWAGFSLLLIDCAAFPILNWVYVHYVFDPTQIG